jgi:GMP synthase-like glutamine amidotransferase
MKPVAIFRHKNTEGPGYFATYLDEHRIPWVLVKIDAGESVPADAREYSGLAFMGGPMSVNDPLPWIPRVLALINGAVAADIPVLGHCLGGQLISKALGGVVSRNPVWEIGWGRVTVEASPEARRWFGELREFLSFHWHGETFTIPPGAARLVASPYCANQAFALGKHLGMQCHVEMTPGMIGAWCRDWRKKDARNRTPSIQSPEEMQKDLEPRVEALNAVARRLYARWIEGLA